MPDVDFTSPWSGKKYKFQWENEGADITPEDYDFFSRQIEQIETGTKQSALGAFGSGVGQGLATMPGTVLQGVGAMVGSTGLEEAGKYSAQQAREAFPIDPMRREDFTTQAGQAVGQAIGQLGLAIGTGGGSLGTGLVLGTAAAMGAASGSDRAAESGLTGARRMGRVYGSALVELGSERIFGLGSKSFFSPAKIPTTFGQKALRAAGTAGGEGAEEVVAGVGNNVLDNLTALGLDIPTPDIVGMKAFKSYGEQGLLGIVGGTVFAGAQLALGNQAAATPVTRSFATVDGVETEVTGMTEDDLKSMRVDPATVRHETVLPAEDARVASSIQNPNVRNLVTEMQSSTDTNALDSALNLGAAANVLTQAAASVAPPVTPAPSVTPATDVTPAPEPTAVVSPVPAVAPTAAQSVEIPATGLTNLVDFANAGFSGTITQTPPPDAPQIRQVSEGNIVQYPSGNEVGTAPEAGDSNRPVEGGQVEQGQPPVVQGETVISPEVQPTEEGLLNVIAPREKGGIAKAADDLVKGVSGKSKKRPPAAAVAAAEAFKASTAAAAAAAAPASVPTTPPTTQEIVDSIQSIAAGVTGETAPAPETLGTGATAPSETISLQQESVPTGSLPAAEAPMPGGSGGGVAPTIEAAPTPTAATPEAAPEAATAAEAEPPVESPSDIRVEETPEKPEPNVAEAEDTSILGKIKIIASQFFGKDNPLSLKDVQSYEKLLKELVRPNYFDGSATHDEKNNTMFLAFVDILQNGGAVNKLREFGIEINEDLGANDALPGAILVEMYKYANRQKDSDSMLQALETVGSTFYYNVGGSGRASARGLGIIQYGLKELARANQTSIANKAIRESAAKITGIPEEDVKGMDKAAATAVVDGADLAAGLEEVSVPNGESVAAIVTPLLNSVPQKKKPETRPTPGEQTPTEADFAAEADRKRLEQEAKGQDPETNEQIREYLYTKVDGAVTAPTINATKARELIAKKLGFTPKNVSYENTDIPNENGNQYSGKVNLATKQITINLRNIKDSAHLTDVLMEEMDHLVYADPMVQAEISLLSENLPDDIKAEVASLRYKPEVQREEATIRFMRRLANEPNTSSLWKRFVDAVRAAFRRLFNGRLTERDLKMAADRVAARSFRAMAAQSNRTGTRFSFAGEQSIKNLSGERRKFMADSLDAAKAMAAAGKSSEEIRAVTGWFPGFGKGNEKLRWEIPDNEVVFRKDEYFSERDNDEESRFIVSRYYKQKQEKRLEEALSRVSGAPRDVLIAESRKLAETNKQESQAINDFYAGEGRENKVNNRVPLGYILDHPALFEAYPELNWVPVSFNPKDVDVLSDGQFSRSTGVIGINPLNTNKDILSTLLHEIQHVIQSKENFASGGNPASMVKMFDFIGLAVNRTKLSDSLKAAADLQDTVGTFTNETVAALPQYQINIAFSAHDDSGGTDGRWKTSSELRTEAEKIDDSILDIDITGYESYQRIAGEYEARDVQARQNLTPEQRKATAPYSSENIAEEDAIVMFGSGGPQASMSMPSPEAQRIDQEYMAAVEAGDMETAQRLVDEAAKAAAKPFSVKTQRKDFSTETAVSIGGKTVSVFRDPENGYWYFADKGGLGNFIATSKEKAIQAAVERIEDEQGGAEPSTTVQFSDWKKRTTITLPGFYLRFGDLPKEGKSVKGNQPGEFEQGVSVLKAWRSPDGVFVISSFTAETGSSDMVSGLRTRPVYIAYGEDTGKIGSDGEPLLKNVVLTEQVINNRIVVDDPSYIDQPITNIIKSYDKWETIEPAPDPLFAAETVVTDDAGNIIPPSKRFEESSDDTRYSLPDPNEPAPAVPDVGPNALTRETVAAESVLDRLNKFILGYEREANEPKTAAKKAAAKKVAKKAAAPKPKPKKEEVAPNVSAVQKFIDEFKKNSGVEKTDAEPKVKNPAKETLQRYTKLPKKKDGPGYPLDEDGETAFMSDLTQELVDLGVPVALAAEASAYAWARYSTKKQDQIDKKALAEFEKAQTEKARQEKRTEAEAQAAKDKPNNTAKAYIKNASADPSTAKEKIKNPVTQALNEAAKISRQGPAFDSSPQAKNAFMTGLSSKLMSLGVDSQTAWSASNVAWDKYQTALEAKAASLLKEFEKNIPATLARKIKELPVFRQNDAEYVRQYIKDLFIFAGLTPEVADAATTLYSAKYAQMLKDARVKAATKYIENEASPRTKDVLKKRPNELDKILEAIRLGVTDPSMTVALALADQSKFQKFTQEEHNRMVALEEEINDEDTPNLIKLERTQELVKLAESKMNDFNAIKAFTGYLVGNTLSGIGTAAIQIWTPAYSMGNRLATDGMRGLLTGDPKRFIASLTALMNSADSVNAEFKYAFGNDVYRRGQQAELQTLSELRKVLDKNIPIFQNPKSGVEKAVAAAKIALAAPDYVRRLYSSMDTASQSLFINQIRQVGLYDLLRKNGMDMKKFQIMLEAKRLYRDSIITTLTLEGRYTPTQIRLIAEDSAIEDFGVKVAEAIGEGGAQQVADLFRTSVNEGKSEIGVSDQVDGHAIPAILKILEGVKSAVDSVAGEKGQGAGDLAFRLIIGYPTTALKVLNRSLYFFPPTAALRYLTNRYYENQPDFDPKADRVYPLLETHSQKLQRLSEAVMGSLTLAILIALLWEDKDKEEKDRRFIVHNLGPSDRAAKQAWRAAGNVPQSIQWRASETSPWISVSWAKAGLEALAPVLATVGTMTDVSDAATADTKLSENIIGSIGGVMGVFNRPLSGINDIGEILSGEKNSISQKSLASYTAFRASGLVPFSSLLKTVNRLEGPRDMSTATSTMLSQIPIAGPMLTEPAINMFGDPLGATPNEMSYKMPILPVQVGIRRQDVPFYEKILSKGQYPPLKLRTNFEKTYGPVSDLVWRQYVEKRGQMVKKLIIDRWTDLDKLSPEAYDKVLGKFANAADDVAIQELNIRRLPK
jgi:hypothetical protein